LTSLLEMTLHGFRHSSTFCYSANPEHEKALIEEVKRYINQPETPRPPPRAACSCFYCQTQRERAKHAN
jgi:hypothetical protein